MESIPVGVQLYSVRDDCARDLPGTLAAIQKMGYAGVEFAGYYDYSARDLNHILRDLDLKCCGAHIGLDQLLEDALPRTVDFHLELGNRYLVVPWIPEGRRSSAAAWQATAETFNAIADRLKPFGLLTGYHNHSEEFMPLEGKTGFDWFFGSTVQDVIMQLDIGNALHGIAQSGSGVSPLDILRRYPGRAVTIHYKEYSANNPDALLGQGDVPWKEVQAILESQGLTQWTIIEQESYPISPLECIAASLAGLHKVLAL